MKCYRKNGSDSGKAHPQKAPPEPSMKCYRKNGSDADDDRAAYTIANPQ